MTPQPERVLDLFERTGAYLQGHFRLSSGLHSSGYLQSALVLQYPKHAELLGRKLAEALSGLTKQQAIGSVISPALGGLIIGHEVARALGVRFLFTERDADRKMSLRRGFSIAPGEKVIVIEDVITTGGSTREVIDVVTSHGSARGRGGLDYRPQRRRGGSWHSARRSRNPVGARLGTRTMPAVSQGRARDQARLPVDAATSRVGLGVKDAAGSRVYLGNRESSMSRRIRITLAWDGTDFHGWQVQPGLPTIQGVLEEIVGAMEGKPVHVAGSGRTDAGVHARAQVAAFTLTNPIPADNLQRAVNRLLPPAIRVLDAVETDADFHPRFDAIAKTYQYTIHRAPICSPFEWRYVHHYPYPLNEDAMIAAAGLFEGEHDFTAFAASDNRDEEGKSKVRTIFGSTMARSGGSPDLHRSRQRLPEAYGAEYRGHAHRNRPRESGFSRYRGAVVGGCTPQRRPDRARKRPYAPVGRIFPGG